MTETQFRRRNLRLPADDYATPGAYFVTICIQNRACVLGAIIGGDLQSSPVGEMVDTHLHMAMDRYSGVELDSYVLMPNHLHAIVNIGWSNESNHAGLPLPENGEVSAAPQDQETTSLFRVMNWLKSATTNEYIRRVKTDGWTRFPGKLWQPNYYEHVIRDQRELDRIGMYIAGNPGKWESDTEYSSACSGFAS